MGEDRAGGAQPALGSHSQDLYGAQGFVWTSGPWHFSL